MKEPDINPVYPVFDSNESIIEIAKNQSQYKTLPALVLDENTLCTRWRIPWIHRIRILFTGNLFIDIMTFRIYEWREKQSEPLYPMYLWTQIKWLVKIGKWFDNLGDRYRLLSKNRIKEKLNL